MPEGKHKSRSLRIVHRRTPGGRNVIHYRKRKPSAAKCAQCGDKLKGVARERVPILRNMPKSSKRPERAFGGKLCSACSRRAIIDRVR